MIESSFDIGKCNAGNLQPVHTVEIPLEEYGALIEAATKLDTIRNLLLENAHYSEKADALYFEDVGIENYVRGVFPAECRITLMKKRTDEERRKSIGQQ